MMQVLYLSEWVKKYQTVIAANYVIWIEALVVMIHTGYLEWECMKMNKI